MTDPEKDPEKKHRDTANNVAVILAIGISASLFLVTAALLAAAWMRFSAGVGEGLSENGTQLLTGWGGGIIGVLGSYIGFTFGKKVNGEPFLPGAPPPKPPEKPDDPQLPHYAEYDDAMRLLSVINLLRNDSHLHRPIVEDTPWVRTRQPKAQYL